MRMRHNGYEINYDVKGSGPPLVLIHGVGSSLRSWDHVVDRLRDAYRVLRYDTLGHGNSEKPDGPYALDDYVSELLALLDAEGIERANIVGSSFGGMIAQAFAIAHQERVATVAFLSAVAALRRSKTTLLGFSLPCRRNMIRLVIFSGERTPVKYWPSARPTSN